MFWEKGSDKAQPFFSHISIYPSFPEARRRRGNQNPGSASAGSWQVLPGRHPLSETVKAGPEDPGGPRSQRRTAFPRSAKGDSEDRFPPPCWQENPPGCRDKRRCFRTAPPKDGRGFPSSPGGAPEYSRFGFPCRPVPVFLPSLTVRPRRCPWHCLLRRGRRSHNFPNPVPGSSGTNCPGVFHLRRERWR